MLDVIQLPLGAYRTNCYLVAREGASAAAVIDPGDAPDTVLSVLADRAWEAAGVLLTHGHHDHLGAVRRVAEAAGVDVWMPRGEAGDLRGLAAGPYEPDHLLDGGELVSVAGIDFDTTPVPGHSPRRSPTTPRGTCSPATCSSPDRSAAPTSPAATWPRCSRASAG
ncbi:MAG TPA: MBL fold metallo-hydrolase [Gaiellales bacterium]|nr:MBL fold metallo-hydrolase [Gaiellales bacterium]